MVIPAPAADPYPGRQEWREEQDLYAQRQMAKWAFWMLFVSAVGVLVGAVGLIFLKGTLDAARDTNQSALDSIRVTREIGQAQVRAYLSFMEPAFHLSPKIRISFFAKNSGQSPARHLRVTEASCGALLHQATPHWEDGAHDYDFSVNFGDVPASDGMQLFVDAPYTQEQAERIRSLIGRHFVGLDFMGVIRWDDAFGVPFEEVFMAHVHIKQDGSIEVEFKTGHDSVENARNVRLEKARNQRR
ncbi:MAG: hypothetical protein CMF04_03335 [Hyphomonas sp.]|nr:hypothetical protein [Hyphomonas sp.]